MSRRPELVRGTREADRLLVIVAFAALALLLTCIAFRRIGGADFWWQFKTGEYVLRHGFPTGDVFSFTVTGAPWIELRWLYCVFIYGITSTFGFTAPVVFKWLTMALAFSGLGWTARRAGSPVLTAGVVLIALLAASQRFYVRPELVTYLLFVGYLVVVDHWRTRGGKILFILPALQVIWTNAHTLFILGPVVLGILLAASALPLVFHSGRPSEVRRERLREVRIVGMVFLLTTLACFVNPYGMQGFLFPFRLFTEIRGTIFKEWITEFRSPFAFSPGFVALAYYKTLIGLCFVAGIANVRRLDPFWTLLCGTHLFLSALAIRNIPLFCFAAIPFAVQNLAPLGPRLRRWSPRLPIALARVGALAVLIVSLHSTWELTTDRFYIRQNDTNQFGVGLAHHRYPIEAVEFVRSEKIPGPVFATMRFGSYLLARDHPVFLDPRLEVYGEDHFERFVAMAKEEEAWRQAVQEFDIRTAVLDLKSPFLRWVLGRDEWDLVYFDPAASVVTRSPAPCPAIENLGDFQTRAAEIRARLGVPRSPDDRAWWERRTNPIPYREVADFLLLFGLHDLAEPFLRDAVSAYPGVRGVHGRYARILLSRGEIPGAALEFEAALEESPDDPELQFTAARCFLRGGRSEEALALLEDCIERDPSHALAWALLGKVHASSRRFEEAIGHTRRAVELDPGNATLRKNLGALLANQGERPAAIEELRTALSIDSTDPILFRDLTLLLVQEGRTPEAEVILERGLERHPDHPDLSEISDRLK